MEDPAMKEAILAEVQRLRNEKKRIEDEKEYQRRKAFIEAEAKNILDYEDFKTRVENGPEKNEFVSLFRKWVRWEKDNENVMVLITNIGFLNSNYPYINQEFIFKYKIYDFVENVEKEQARKIFEEEQKRFEEESKKKRNYIEI